MYTDINLCKRFQHRNEIVNIIENNIIMKNDSGSFSSQSSDSLSADDQVVNIKIGSLSLGHCVIRCCMCVSRSKLIGFIASCAPQRLIRCRTWKRPLSNAFCWLQTQSCAYPVKDENWESRVSGFSTIILQRYTYICGLCKKQE